MSICVFPPHYQLVYINFDISSFSLISYMLKFSYIRKYISLYTQQKEARNIAPELYNYRRMNPEQRAKSACVNLRGNTDRQL